MAAAKASNETHKPKLIVFDLDYTLWPFWVDTHVDAPFTKEKSGKVYDVARREVSFYPDVPEVLADLHSQGYKLGIASRTSCKKEANELTHLFNWDRFFQYREIFTGSKTAHFAKTGCIEEANDLITLFDWELFFEIQFREIYPGSKTRHFANLQKKSGVAYEDMIFFDDEHRNIVEVGKMGVLCIFVKDGVTKSVIEEGIKEFANRRRRNIRPSVSTEL